MGYEGKWEKRWHPLREEWVVYAAHRNSRPWQGAPPVDPVPAQSYDPQCYLCPGNPRSGGILNPPYRSIFIFDNDHPVVGESAPEVPPALGFYRNGRADGIARVICYNPRHDVPIAGLAPEAVTEIFAAFRDQTAEMASNPAIHSILIFENRGEAVGVSNPHPHCQLYATGFPLRNVTQQMEVSSRFRKENGSDIFSAIIEAERMDGRRILFEDEHAIAFIPYFARWAYEVMIFPKAPAQRLTDLAPAELNSLAIAFRTVIRKYDLSYGGAFPYVMSVMQAPVDGGDHPDFRLHVWLQPPYRQPGLVKYLAGPELGAGNFMADTMPEEKAAELRLINAD